ncbi:MAG: hypothetical protein H0Z34_01445 [Brevibacillus sp.]|nr:hypothetical protein [Brevibacillus sp.]
MEERTDIRHTDQREATIAPGMEMDELEEEATPEEIRKGDYTPVTKLIRDFVE